MIKLKTSEFMGFSFSQSIQKLSSHAFPVKTAYAVKKIVDSLQRQRNAISDDYLEIVKKYATKNPDGSIHRPKAEDPNGFDIPPELLDAYKAEEREFGEREFTLDRPQLCLSDLEGLSLSAAELSQLEPLIAGEPDASTGQIATVTQLPTAAAPAPADTETASPA